MMDWFRLYTKTIRKRELRARPPAERWLWITLLCLARDSEVPGKLYKWGDVPITIQDMADAAAISIHEAEAGLLFFLQTGDPMLLLRDGVYEIVKWKQYQYDSDSSTERVRAYRKRKSGNVSGNVSGNGPEAESESEHAAALRDSALTNQKGESKAQQQPRGRAQAREEDAAPRLDCTHPILLSIQATPEEFDAAEAVAELRPNAPPAAEAERRARYDKRLILDGRQQQRNAANNGRGKRETANEQVIRELREERARKVERASE